MKSILLTGAEGQLGNEIRRISVKYPQFRFLFTDVAELDITDEAALIQFLDENPVDFIVNAAAYTAVDKAEEEEATAFLINAEAVDLLATQSAGRNIQLIHISTDYVFNGKGNRPYAVDEKMAPETAYGRSKKAGEEAVKKSGKGIIIRTSWLYSVFGNNFVKTILRLSGEREKLQVVFDQTGSPTNARDLAAAILEMIDKESAPDAKPRFEIYHFANEGICSWFEFAREIIRIAGSNCQVDAVTSEQYVTAAKRPRYSVLDIRKTIIDYNLTIPHWKDSLKDCLEELVNK